MSNDYLDLPDQTTLNLPDAVNAFGKKVTQLPTPDHIVGDPKVISDTKGEEITPDNPEVVKQFPVENTKEAHDKVEKEG